MAIALSRRRFLTHAGLSGAALITAPAYAQKVADLAFVNGKHALDSDFPQKGEMILQRAPPPLLETPMAVFDQGIFTPGWYSTS